ncbi:MAG: hypothetical protein JSW00_11710 [Thermoplasmata archaeon]|nr:MAG: hypothetical protein JSW00_11710 [Thermoplasmata archaeon]
MSKRSEDEVAFDILLRSPASGQQPSVSTIDQFRPPHEEIERCRRYLVSRGVEAHATEFGLACKAPRDLFESLFAVSLKPTKPVKGTPPFKMVGEPKPPMEIAEAIEQITISAPPEFF